MSEDTDKDALAPWRPSLPRVLGTPNGGEMLREMGPQKFQGNQGLVVRCLVRYRYDYIDMHIFVGYSFFPGSVHIIYIYIHINSSI